jgi:hypothetical protein
MYPEASGAVVPLQEESQPEPRPYPHRCERMKAITAALVAVFILWVVDVNLNGSRYTNVVVQMVRATISSTGVRN